MKRVPAVSEHPFGGSRRIDSLYWNHHRPVRKAYHPVRLFCWS